MSKAIPLILAGAAALTILSRKGQRRIGRKDIESDPVEPKALELIKKLEVFSASAYPDPGDPKNGPVTIGYGTTSYPDGSPILMGDKVTEPEASALAQKFIVSEIIPKLSKDIQIWSSMTSGEKAAIISFAYNLGENFYGRKGFSKITAALNSPQYKDAVPAALRLYVFAGGHKMQGLINRREDEIRTWRG